MKSTNQERQTSYQPFGDEWKKEIMKMKKADIIFMYATAAKEWLRKEAERKEMILEKDRKLWEIIRHHGSQAQIMIIVEELSELIRAIADMERNNFCDIRIVAVVGKVAGVIICMQQLMRILNISKGFMYDLINQKLDGELKRIADEKTKT